MAPAGTFSITFLVLVSISLRCCMVKAFISNGFYAISDEEYDGAVSDGTTSTFLLGTKYMHSEQMWNSSACARECKMLCIKKNCKSFVINRATRTCYVTSFDRCTDYTVYLRRIPEYITYEIVPAENVPPNGIKTTCVHKCLISGNCDNCGRRYCTGESCDICQKTCWEIPLSVNSTYFWPDLRTVIHTNCYNAWQTIYTHSISLSYAHMLLHPLWLNVVIHVSDGTTYDSYFDSFTMTGLVISVGNYLGGSAGNFWNAPFTDLPEVYDNETNCAPFFHNITNCSVPQIDSINTQMQMNETIFKRGYVWTICGNDFGNSSVLDIELIVTPTNVTFMNDTSFVNNLIAIDCTPITTTVFTTTTDTTTPVATTPDATTTPDVTTTLVDTTPVVTTTPDATTTPVVTTPDVTTTPVVTTPDVTTTPDATITPVVTTPDATTTPEVTTTIDAVTTPVFTTPDVSTIPAVTTQDISTTPAATTPVETITPVVTTPVATTTPVVTTPDTTTAPIITTLGASTTPVATTPDVTTTPIVTTPATTIIAG